MIDTIKVKKGVPLTMDADQNPSFGEWLDRCDRLARVTRGISIHDLPDVCWRDWYDERLRPIRAVNRALRYASE
jgi:hypothetical protein